uniref:Uncharacterized protein n=1 Tax=Poecilia latipinna TaxID=48699 RepID=A0A3B3TNJ2_9TELE
MSSLVTYISINAAGALSSSHTSRYLAVGVRLHCVAFNVVEKKSEFHALMSDFWGGNRGYLARRVGWSRMAHKILPPVVSGPPEFERTFLLEDRKETCQITVTLNKKYITLKFLTFSIQKSILQFLSSTTRVFIVFILLFNHQIGAKCYYTHSDFQCSRQEALIIHTISLEMWNVNVDVSIGDVCAVATC